MAGVGWRNALSNYFCKYCNGLHLKTLTQSSRAARRLSTANLFHKGLDQDASWEAEILRHERHLDELKKQGVKNKDLPVLSREEKVQSLPHFTFKKSSEMKREDSNLDFTSKVILGHVGSEGLNTSLEKQSEHTNVDQEFIREDVQTVLQRIHFRCDMEKVFKHEVKERETMATVKFFTDEQLKEEQERFRDAMKEKIKMPFVMTERERCDSVLSEDSILDGYEESNVTFVDISQDIPNHRERFIVVRQPDGMLRKAAWEERDRLIQVYFPIPGRQIAPQPVFKDDHLKTALQHNLHENVLDRCILHMEPDSTEYIRVTTKVYNDVDNNRLYDNLRSTRHFGVLVFFLVKNSRIDGLLNNMLNRGLLEDAADVIRLFVLLNPESKTACAAQSLSEEQSRRLIEAYVENDCQDVKLLSLALASITPLSESV